MNNLAAVRFHHIDYFDFSRYLIVWLLAETPLKDAALFFKMSRNNRFTVKLGSN